MFADDVICVYMYVSICVVVFVLFVHIYTYMMHHTYISTQAASIVRNWLEVEL
jgi:hypothetical protein